MPPCPVPSHTGSSSETSPQSISAYPWLDRSGARCASLLGQPRLQPYDLKAATPRVQTATPRVRGCDRMYSRLRPYVPRCASTWAVSPSARSWLRWCNSCESSLSGSTSRPSGCSRARRPRRSGPRTHAAHMQCTCSAHAIQIQCTRSAHAVHTQCTCSAHAMHMQCVCSAHAAHTQCTCTCNAHAGRDQVHALLPVVPREVSPVHHGLRLHLRRPQRRLLLYGGDARPLRVRVRVTFCTAVKLGP